MAIGANYHHHFGRIGLVDLGDAAALQRLIQLVNHSMSKETVKWHFCVPPLFCITNLL